MTFLGLLQRSEDIYREEFEGSSCRKYSKGVRPFPELRAILRTGRTVTDCFVYIGGHLRPIILLTAMLVHAGLSRVAGQYLVMREVEYEGSERIG